MVLVKILGGIDLLSAIAFLMLIFGLHVPLQYLLFCAGLLLVKSLFMLAGDVLSLIDLYSSVLLLLSLLFMPFASLLWISAFLLTAKGLVSFI